MSKGTHIRVQMTNGITGRHRLSVKGYDNIRSAYHAMRAKARVEFCNLNGLATVDSDKNTHITLTSGRQKRIFTLVLKRGGEPVPFGHLFTSVVPEETPAQ